MMRALTALVGFALAAVVLYFVSDAGDVISDPTWAVPSVWAAAGLVAGIFYQAGGARRPGMRVNVPLFILVFLPWTIVGASLVATSTGDPSWLADQARSIAGEDVLNRLLPSLAAFAFGSGLLLAFSMLEPRTAVVVEERTIADADDDTIVRERQVIDNDTTIVRDPVVR